MNFKTILDRSDNIGALCNYIRKRDELLVYLNQAIPEEISYVSIPERVYYLLNDIKTPLVCDCGKLVKFKGFKSGHYKTCGDQKCAVRERKKTCMENWGVDNPKKSQDIINKEQLAIKERWGGQHYLKNPEVRKKFNQSMLENWGVEWAQQSPEIQEKGKQTWIANPNREIIIRERQEKFINKSKEEKEQIKSKKFETLIEKWGSIENWILYSKNKSKQTSQMKWGVDHHFESEIFIQKRVRSYIQNITNKILEKLPPHLKYIDRSPNPNGTDSYFNLHCTTCNQLFSITRQLFDRRHKMHQEICLGCNPILDGSSQKELAVLDFITQNYSGLILHREKLRGCEVDIFIPELKLGFEFNGLFWHSDNLKQKDYHLNKSLELQEEGIRLIHIWEDDWDNKEEIIKSLILNNLGKTSIKIAARKCQIQEVGNKEARDFLDKNHLQGFVGAKTKLGLFYNQELVSLMTFGALRKSLGQTAQKGNYELLRFCNKIGHNVVGGASKLISHFIKNYEVEKIMSYADFSRSNGDMYKKIGFECISRSQPNYYYIINGIRKHRFNFRKDKLVKLGADPELSESKIMESRGINRIWDCGMLKFEMNI